MGRTFAAYLSASPFTAATAPLRATWSLGLPTVPSGCLDALVCSSAALPLTLLRFSKRLKYELLAEQGGMAMRNLLAAFVLVSLSTLPANAQAWRNCVQGSIGPGGCDSIGPGGGRSRPRWSIDRSRRRIVHWTGWWSVDWTGRWSIDCSGWWLRPGSGLELWAGPKDHQQRR